MKKILMGVTGTAMVATATANHIMPNNQITSSTKVSESNGTIQNTTTVNDIKITTEGTVEKFSRTTTKNLNYIPETSVPATGNIVTSGTTLKFNLNIILLGTHGKCQNIKNITASIDTKASYGLSNLTPEEQEELNSLIKSISTTSASVDNPNSESTIHLEPEIHFSNTDWNVEVDPTLKINITLADGKVATQDIKLDKLLETNKYVNNVKLSSGLSRGSKSGQYYVNLGGGCSVNGDDTTGVYNPANQTMQTMTFKIKNYDPSQLKITPLNISGLTVNKKNGTYTITKTLLNSGKKLFEIDTIGDKAIQSHISFEPISVNMKSSNSNLREDYNRAYINNYKGSSVYINQEANTTFTMEIFSNNYRTKQNTGIGWNNSGVNFDTTMSNDVPGKYKIYTGSLVSNGEILVKSSNYSYNLISNNQVYCHLNSSTITELQSGTTAQKAQIMEAITSGDMTGIGVSYTGVELSKLMSEGKTVPELNFTYVEDNYNGRHTNIGGSYQTIPTDGNGKPVISRTITYGKLVGTYTDSEKETIAKAIADGQASSDGIIGKGSTYQGFILSPLKYTNSYFDKNYAYPKVIRYGNYSQGISSTFNSGKITTGTIIGNIGSVRENTTNNENYTWLLKPHSFSLTIQGFGDGPELLMNNSTITINMGHSFELVNSGNININGYISIPASDVTVEGDKLIIKMTPAIAQAIGQAPYIDFQAKYTNVENLPNSINIQAGISGPDSSDGMIYKYNNKKVSVQQGGMPSFSNYKTTVKFNYKNMNVGSHYILNTSGNTSTLGDTIINVGNYSKTYYIAGEIPQDGTTGLAGNLYCPNAGGLSTEMESIDSHGAPVWVLPKSAMTLKNQELLTSPTGMDLKGALSYIESTESGWVKYKSGMSLNNIIGYFVTPTVKPESAYSMNYNLKLTNINSTSSVPQAVNSAFKYFDATDNVGTVSSVVTMTPPNSNSEPTWFSNVNEVGGKLTKADLDNTIKFNGKAISLKDLIGSGYDEDDNWDNTPTKLMNKVILANDAKALKALGYKLVNITVDGKLRDLSWFNNIGIVNNTNSLTEVTFNIKKIDAASTTIDVVDKDGKILYTNKTSNAVGSPINDSPSEIIPKGYKVASIIVNGKEVPLDKVPTTQSKDNQTIIYTVGKQLTKVVDTVKVVCPSDSKLDSIVTKIGTYGSNTELSEPSIPKGYHVVSVTNSTKGLIGIPKTFGDSDNTTTITIAKNIKDKTHYEIVTDKGITVVPMTEANGSEVPGDKVTVTIPTIKGYEVTGVIINGKSTPVNKDGVYTVTNNSSVSVESDNIIKVIVKQLPVQDTIKIIMPSGISRTIQTISGLPNTSANIESPKLPLGVHIGKVVITDDNGKVISNTVPKEFGDGNETITYHLEENASNDITSKVVSEDTDKTLVKETIVAEGPEGSIETVKPTTIPEGYHLVKVTYNGNTISSIDKEGKVTFTLPTSIPTKEGKLVYYVAANKSSVKVEVIDGTKVISSKTYTGNVNSPIGDYTPDTTGYNVDNITVNGTITSKDRLPKDYTNKVQTIIYHVKSLKGKLTYIIDIDGHKHSTTIDGTNGDTASYNLPHNSRLKLESITVNGKEIPVAGNTDYHGVYSTNGNVVVYNYKEVKPDTNSNDKHEVKPSTRPDIEDKTYIKVIIKGSNINIPEQLVPETSKEEAPGAKGYIKLPEVPNGYKIVSLTINGVSTPISKDSVYEIVNNSSTTKEIDNKVVIIVEQVKPSTKPNVKPETNSNDKHEVKPEVKPSTKPSVNEQNSTSTKIQTLPDTGLNTTSSNTENEAGVVAGILGLLGSIFLFRRKK